MSWLVLRAFGGRDLASTRADEHAVTLPDPLGEVTNTGVYVGDVVAGRPLVRLHRVTAVTVLALIHASSVDGSKRTRRPTFM